MIWKIRGAYTILLFAACMQRESTKSSLVSSSYLIDAEELLSIAKVETTRILDFRKKEAYKKEHIAGAVNIWRTDIEDSSYVYKGMMASPAQIESVFGNLGIKTNDVLVIYDDNGLCDASRLWWILQNYNYINVKLLQGGIHAWKTNGGDVTQENPPIEKTTFKLTRDPELRYNVSKGEVLKALDHQTVILDTRTTDEFEGKYQKKGASKAGRIQNSVNIDWSEAIYYNGDRRFKSVEELEKTYSRLNISKDDPLVVYCHSGVRSAHTFFVLTQLLGYKNVKNYDGSWTEWSYFDDLPFQKDTLRKHKIK